MSGFTAAWLALREPADEAARALAVVEPVTQALANRANGHRTTVVDLGAGTGANLRWLAPRLDCPQRWRLIDVDSLLLDRAADAWQEHALHDVVVETVRADVRNLDDGAVLAGVDLVTASALLDLVSESWIVALANLCAARRALILFALTYNGRITFDPRDTDDEQIVGLVNAHQRTDKGFGPALGPSAAARTTELFAARGYRVQRAQSDWHLGHSHAALQLALLDGWATAAAEMQPAWRAAIAEWYARRRAHVEAGRSRIAVGHEDLAGTF